MGRCYPRQVLRVVLLLLILAGLALLSTNVQVELPATIRCPDVTDLLFKIQKLRMQPGDDKDAEAARTAGLAALGRLGINLTQIVGPIGQPLLEQNDVAMQPTPKPTEFTYEEEPPETLLDPSFAPNNVFYVWCGKRWFEFQHYLSVKSVIRELRPDNIVFYYDAEPVTDSWTYNTWFMELKQEYPFFRTYYMNVEDSARACEALGKPSLAFITERLTAMGGMYISENTLISHFPLKFRSFTFVHALNVADRTGLLMAKRGYPGNRTLDNVIRDPQLATKDFFCTSPEHYIQLLRKPLCVNSGAFFPKDIWELENSFGKLARRIFYGKAEIALPAQNYDVLIPNIAHMVWIGGGPMDFLFYLSVLSLIYVAEVDMVYIHGDAPPTGPYWNRIRRHPQLTLVYRETPKSVYGTRVEVLSHVTDVWRVDFMVKYGGIYVDTDTVFVQKLDKDIRAYDAVGAYDWTYWNHPFPDTINFGVAIGKKNALYWRKFQESMKWFMDNDWSWNGLRQPYRIKERHPDLVKIDPRLQVICYQSLCHPTWWPDYHNESVHHLNSHSIKDWRTDTYAFHWTLPTPFELQNEDNLLITKSSFADVGKYVLERAGLLETFKKEIKLRKKVQDTQNNKQVPN